MALKHTVRPYGSGSRRTATGEPDRLRIDSDMRLSRVRQLPGGCRIPKDPWHSAANELHRSNWVSLDSTRSRHPGTRPPLNSKSRVDGVEQLFLVEGLVQKCHRSRFEGLVAGHSR